MKQYCRYCTYLCAGNGVYCGIKNKVIKESTAKATNNCKDFDYNPIDAFFENEKGYTERTPKKVI